MPKPIDTSFTARDAVRVLLAIFFVLLGIAAAIAVIAASGHSDAPYWYAGGLFVLAGFAGLAVARAPAAPLRPLRIALIVALSINVGLIVGLPFPPRRAELASFLILWLGMLLTIIALWAASRSPRSATIALGVLGAYGLYLMVRVGHAVTENSGSAGSGTIGPAATISIVLAESLGAAWIAALWHARILWPAFRNRE